VIRKPSLKMPRHWLRLVTWVSLVAFLITNTPGVLVGAAHLLGAESRHGRACQHACCHACCHEGIPKPDCTAEETSPCTRSGSDSESHTLALSQGTAADEHDRSPCQSCPCSTGGCAHCSVAKAPCCLPGTLLGIPSPCFGQNLTEVPVFFPPAHPGELLRPPIA
jgi:hypothetical protein